MVIDLTDQGGGKVNNQSWLELFIVANMPTWHSRLATSNEKYIVAHSANTQVRFIAVTWEINSVGG